MTTAEAVKKIQQEFDINAIYARSIYMQTHLQNIVDVDMKKIATVIGEKPKPFVKWVGGKRQLLKQFRLMNLYPPEEFDSIKGRYFEPFVGGGAVFFDLFPRKAFLSDLNLELVTAYNVIKDDAESLIKALKKHTHNKEYFLKVRAQKVERLSPLQIASRFIYLNRAGFNGMYRVNSRGEFNVPFGYSKNPLICDEENLRKISVALKNVEIKHQDYKQVLKKAKKGDFVYFDPPYHPVSKTAAFTSYTANGFSEKDQTELRDAFLELNNRGCFVMLSNSDAPFINEIYSGFKGIRISKVEAGRAINSKGSGRGKVKEVLVTNY